MRTMYRHEIPVDDQFHQFKISEAGYPLTFNFVWQDNDPIPGSDLVGKSSYVEFWAEHDDTYPERTVTYKVYGTGHPIGDGDHPADQFVYVGTAPRVRGLVFHVFEYIAAD